MLSYGKHYILALKRTLSMTLEGDLVLVYMDEKPAFFARIEEIGPDPKPDWFQVKMLVLQVPPLVVTWILREPYINGDGFTMGGRPMRLEKVISPEEQPASADAGEQLADQSHKSGDASTAPDAPKPEQKGKVVSIFDRAKKNHSS